MNQVRIYLHLSWWKVTKRSTMKHLNLCNVYFIAPWKGPSYNAGNKSTFHFTVAYYCGVPYECGSVTLCAEYLQHPLCYPRLRLVSRRWNGYGEIISCKTHATLRLCSKICSSASYIRFTLDSTHKDGDHCTWCCTESRSTLVLEYIDIRKDFLYVYEYVTNPIGSQCIEQLSVYLY